MLHISQAADGKDLDIVRTLLREYQASIGVDLCFQGFESELRELPGSYVPPAGRLLVATHEGDAIGCVALQAIDAARGEMKRLYVRPTARGLGVGRTLVSRLLAEARTIGYLEIVLDTLPTMTEALRLYGRFGFRDIGAYRLNPIPGARYLAKSLQDAG